MTIDEALEHGAVAFTEQSGRISCTIYNDTAGALHKDRCAMGQGSTADEAFQEAVKDGQAQEWLP